MSYLKNTLNFASYSYDASTDTPALAKMKDGTVFEVATAGKVVGTAISGCTLGADSYLLVGDKVVYKNGGYELLSPKIKNGTTINVGTGGLFTKFKDANDYVSKRVYTGVILNLLSTTVETASIDVQNPCGGRLVIYGNGFFINHSGTVNTNCTLSGNNIYIDDFSVSGNCNKYILEVNGSVTHSNGMRATNVHVTGSGILHTNRLQSVEDGSHNATSSLAISVLTVGNLALVGKNSSFSCLNITANGKLYLGDACSNAIDGVVASGGAVFNCGSTSLNNIVGLVACGAGLMHYGSNSLSYFNAGATGTGGVNANFGSTIVCNGMPMPAGTPAVGTSTAAFRRAS